jgi:hypothetical protein
MSINASRICACIGAAILPAAMMVASPAGAATVFTPSVGVESGCPTSDPASLVPGVYESDFSAAWTQGSSDEWGVNGGHGSITGAFTATVTKDPGAPPDSLLRQISASGTWSGSAMSSYGDEKHVWTQGTIQSYHGVPATWNTPGDPGVEVELHATYTVSYLEEGSWVQTYSGPVIYIDVLMPQAGGTCFSGPARLENPLQHEPPADPIDNWDYPVPQTNMYSPGPQFTQEPVFTLEATDEAKAEHEQRIKNAKSEIDAAVASASRGEAADRDGAIATLQAMLARPEWQEGCEAQAIRKLIIAGIQKVIDVGAAQASALAGSGPFFGDGGKETFDSATSVLGTWIKGANGPPDLQECLSAANVEKGVNAVTLAFFKTAEDLGVPGVRSCNVYDEKRPCDGPTIEAFNLGWDLDGEVQLLGLNPVPTDVPEAVAFKLAKNSFAPIPAMFGKVADSVLIPAAHIAYGLDALSALLGNPESGILPWIERHPCVLEGKCQTVPEPPDIDRVYAGNAFAKVQWSAPAGLSGSPLGTAKAVSIPAGGSCTVPATAKSCVVNGLKNGKSYRFKVRVSNSEGWSAWSEVSRRVTPRGSIKLKAAPKIRLSVAGGTSLRVGLKPALGSGSPWTLKIQTTKAKKWVALGGVRTADAHGAFTLDVNKGQYRVLVPAQAGHREGTSAAVKVTR